MARGYPDYGAPGYAVAANNVDFSQFALAALGVYSLDGLGRVVYGSNFDEGTGTLVDLATPPTDNWLANAQQPEIGVASIKVNVSAGEPDALALFRKSIYVPGVKTVGFQTSFWWWTYCPHIDLIVKYNIDGITSGGWVRMYKDDRTLSYYDADLAALVPFHTLPAPGSNPSWVPIKLVLNAVDRRWKRIVVGQTLFEIDAASVSSGSAVPVGVLGADYNIWLAGAGTSIAYIGHMLLTVDEP